jgi:hypothetical protein
MYEYIIRNKKMCKCRKGLSSNPTNAMSSDAPKEKKNQTKGKVMNGY